MRTFRVTADEYVSTVSESLTTDATQFNVTDFLTRHALEARFATALLTGANNFTTLPHATQDGKTLIYTETATETATRLTNPHYKIASAVYAHPSSIRPLGEGAFGVAHMIINTETGQPACLKVLKQSDESSTTHPKTTTLPSSVTHLIARGTIDQHPFNPIATNKGATTTYTISPTTILETGIDAPAAPRTKTVELYEYLGEDLLKFIKRHKALMADRRLSKTDVDKIKTLPLLLLDCMDQLHQGKTATSGGNTNKSAPCPGIIHTDIKPDNLLVDDTGEALTVSFCDFDRATPLPPKESEIWLPDLIANIYFLAPELARLIDPQHERRKAFATTSLGNALLTLGTIPTEASFRPCPSSDDKKITREFRYSIATDCFAMGSTIGLIINELFDDAAFEQFHPLVMLMCCTHPDARPPTPLLKIAAIYGYHLQTNTHHHNDPKHLVELLKKFNTKTHDPRIAKTVSDCLDIIAQFAQYQDADPTWQVACYLNQQLQNIELEAPLALENLKDFYQSLCTVETFRKRHQDQQKNLPPSFLIALFSHQKKALLEQVRLLQALDFPPPDITLLETQEGQVACDRLILASQKVKEANARSQALFSAPITEGHLTASQASKISQIISQHIDPAHFLTLALLDKVNEAIDVILNPRGASLVLEANPKQLDSCSTYSENPTPPSSPTQ